MDSGRTPISSLTREHALPDGELRLLGAHASVTGAMTRIDMDGRRVLIDCGVAQGAEAFEWQLDDAALDVDMVLLTHGPVDEADHDKWVAHLKVHGEYLQKTLGFKRVEYTTLRDDAPKPVKDAAIAHLREAVRTGAGDSTVIIQPVLISVGMVQAEIVELLKGYQYKMSASGVSSHPLTLEWIRQQAAAARR